MRGKEFPSYGVHPIRNEEWVEQGCPLGQMDPSNVHTLNRPIYPLRMTTSIRRRTIKNRKGHTFKIQKRWNQDNMLT